jgi:hypothetical protein
MEKMLIVLVTGTIAAISPLFIIKGVEAQGGPYLFIVYILDSRF